MRKEQARAALLALALLGMAACSRDGEAAAGAAAARTGPEAGGVPGDPAPEQSMKLVKFGATLYAAPEFCDGLDYDLKGRELIRADQKQKTVAQGAMTAPQFDTAFAAAHAEAKARFASASPDERRQACAQVRQLRKPARQG